MYIINIYIRITNDIGNKRSIYPLISVIILCIYIDLFKYYSMEQLELFLYVFF